MDAATIISGARAAGQVRRDVGGEGPCRDLPGIPSKVVNGRRPNMLQVVECGLQGVSDVLRVQLVKVSRAPPPDPNTPHPVGACGKLRGRLQRAPTVWVYAGDADGQ